MVGDSESYFTETTGDQIRCWRDDTQTIRAFGRTEANDDLSNVSGLRHVAKRISRARGRKYG
jgi:hypothetical protein